ncbi:MAG: aldehyde dehydrogenase family protein, partial [Acidimicrobiia bacterium]|nr:aldehyde dehydrogenase family protein [Acidimicrobiia bacterium]
ATCLLQGDGLGQLGHTHAAEHTQGSAWSHARYFDQLAEGRALLERERFDHVVFTGSTAVGREIAALCARTLTNSSHARSRHTTVR